jgi:type II secretory pathway pseudopilin PulG
MELLAVVAIIGILAAILVPTLSSARTASNKARTRTQFSQWGAAFENFRQEYGSYPQLYTTATLRVVNANASTTATAEHLFHDTLTGHRRDPSGTWPAATTRVPPMPQAQNTRRIQFVSFTDNDFVVQADVTNGLNTTRELNFIRDGFHNTSIAVITDANLDGVINARDAAGGYPAVTVAGGTLTIRPLATDLPTGTTGGVHAGVIFYSAPTGASTGTDLIMSWK